MDNENRLATIIVIYVLAGILVLCQVFHLYSAATSHKITVSTKTKVVEVDMTKYKK